jgi:hypothetical protein
MGVVKSIRFSHILVFAVLLVALSGRAARADACADMGNGVSCCAAVYSDGNQCCWAIACSDGSRDGACSTCILAKVRDGAQKKDTGALMARLLVRDKELSRALSSIR